jgi:outer membrane protein assembly factor BamB
MMILRKTALISTAIVTTLFCVQSLKAQTAEEILAAANVKGGMIVHLGCGDGALTADLHRNDSFRVHGLAFTESELKQARATVQARGLYGDKVSVSLCPSRHLPYRTDMVRLLVAEELRHISNNEVMRVLAPEGVAFLKQGKQWKVVQKPWPAEIDEWTHFLYDAKANPVSRDQRVAPPEQWQWRAGPWYSREHESVNSVNAVVTANGRIFYVTDRDAELSVYLPPEWKLVARDAFSGVLLWERAIPKWITTQWHLKWGPVQLPRRLVTNEDRVYFTCGIDQPVSELDAATGELLQTYPTGGRMTDEILYADGLVLTANTENPTELEMFQVNTSESECRAKEGVHPVRNIMVFEAESGKLKWEQETPYIRTTMLACGKRVYYHNGTKVVARDLQTGAELWQSEAPLPIPGIFTPGVAPRMSYDEAADMLVYVGSENRKVGKGGKNHAGWDDLFGVNAATGETVWFGDDIHAPSAYETPEELYIINDEVWFPYNYAKSDPGTLTALDLATGTTNTCYKPPGGGWHHRCHPGKATERYIISGHSKGIDFFDIANQVETDYPKFVRGACLYGIMPANGFLYAPPNPCQCFAEEMVRGMSALSGARPPPVPPVDDAARLVPGPAYSDPQRGTVAEDASRTWPTYRANPARSGSTSMRVPTKLATGWTTALGGKLTPPTIAQNKVFVANLNTHEVIALNQANGQEEWRFVAGGAVDSPPTVYQSLVLFGSRDGYVYALRASDGELAWRFLAAPHDERMMSDDKLESVWPLHGAVLVDRDIAYVVAGRSPKTDGGLTFYQLDPLTGKQLGKTVYDGSDGIHVMADICSSEGDYVYMRTRVLEADNNLATVDPNSIKDWEHNHLCAPNGFLDGTWWTRSYWVYANFMGGGHAGWQQAKQTRLAGRILVLDDDRVYGYGRDAGDTNNHKSPPQMMLFSGPRDSRKLKPRDNAGKVLIYNDWNSDDIPILARGLLKADDLLFSAGPEDHIRGITSQAEADLHEQDLERQDEAWKGLHGGKLCISSPEDGRLIADFPIESPPVLDGLAAAYGKLYMSRMDGSVSCFKAGITKP